MMVFGFSFFILLLVPELHGLGTKLRHAHPTFRQSLIFAES